MIPSDTELAQLLFQTARRDNYVALPEERHDAALYLGQFRCLRQLEQTDGISQRTLADALQVRPPSLSEVLNRLTQKGLVERRVSEMDRRSMLVFLTEQGREVLQKSIDFQRRLHADMFSALSEEEKSQLFLLLKKVERHGKKEVFLP